MCGKQGAWTVALLSPETLWGSTLQPITWVFHENSQNWVWRYFKSKKREDNSNNLLNHWTIQCERIYGAQKLDAAPVAQGLSHAVSVHVSALFGFHFTLAVWFGVCEPRVHIFMSLGTIYCQACLNSKICFQSQKPQIIYQIGKEMEVIELISYIILNFLSEHWHLPAVRVMCFLGRSNNGEEIMKSDESCSVHLLLMLNVKNQRQNSGRNI